MPVAPVYVKVLVIGAVGSPSSRTGKPDVHIHTVVVHHVEALAMCKKSRTSELPLRIVEVGCGRRTIHEHDVAARSSGIQETTQVIACRITAKIDSICGEGGYFYGSGPGVFPRVGALPAVEAGTLQTTPFMKSARASTAKESEAANAISRFLDIIEYPPHGNPKGENQKLSNFL